MVSISHAYAAGESFIVMASAIRMWLASRLARARTSAIMMTTSMARYVSSCTSDKPMAEVHEVQVQQGKEVPPRVQEIPEG